MRQLTAHSLAWFLVLGLFAATTPALAQEVISLEGIEDDEVIDIDKTAPAKKQRVLKTGLTGSDSATIEIDEGASSAEPKPNAQAATTAGQGAQTTGAAPEAAAPPEASTELAQTTQAKPKAAPQAQIIDTDDASSQGEGDEAQAEEEEEAPAKKKKRAERKKRKK